MPSIRDFLFKKNIIGPHREDIKILFRYLKLAENSLKIFHSNKKVTELDSYSRRHQKS